MPSQSQNGGKCVRYKKIVQVGENSVVGDNPISVIQSKVLCNRQALIEINRCHRCPYNEGLENQYLMKCSRPHDVELPESLNVDEDYEEVKGDPDG